ncbi:MAG: hypothetical protein QXL17_01765 [Candidatus Thermoplasmatota archaeon]
MKKYLVGFVCLMLICLPTLSAAAEFTHTVFAEYGTTTTCPYCPPTSADLYSIYQSEDYPFYYVSLVANKNKLAGQRLYKYKAVAVPVVYFDGGDVNQVGDSGETVYRNIIETMGARTVKQKIDMTTAVTWLGSAKVKVSVTLKSQGLYIGILRSYVTEIVSRWLDADGYPYHFAFLDFAINRPVILLPGIQRTFTKIFDGAATHGDQTFEDITQDNIMVISTISYWMPQKRTGYDDKTYYAFIVDQTSADTAQ